LESWCSGQDSRIPGCSGRALERTRMACSTSTYLLSAFLERERVRVGDRKGGCVVGAGKKWSKSESISKTEWSGDLSE